MKAPTQDDVVAGDAFRNTLVPRADGMSADRYPLWHGWALMDAFLAGAEYARAQASGGGEAAPTPMPVSRYDFTSRGEAVPVRNGLWVDYRDYEALEKLYIKQTNCCEYVTQSPRDDG